MPAGKPNYVRNKELKAFLKQLTTLPVPYSAFIVLIENIEMLNIAYGHVKSDDIIAGLCESIAEKIGTVFRISDNTIIIISKNSENKKVKSELKKLVSQFGLRDNENAAHISALVNFIEIKEPVKNPESVLDKLYSLANGYDQSQMEIKETWQNISRTQMSLANEIYNAVDKKLLRLAYQPIIAARTGKLHHHECLLRIVDKNKKTSSAGSFIQIAEKMGIIENIDLHVLDLVIEKLKQQPEISLSLNISNLSVDSEEWSKQFFEKVTPDIAKRLTIEITETAAMIDLRSTAYFIAKIQGAGSSVALDDFGSGYTSFRQIRGLSLDYVKIDGSLINDIVNNHHNQLLVKSLIEFLKGLGLKTIAEFVDGGDTAKFLINCGIDYMQGNYFGAASENFSLLPSQ